MQRSHVIVACAALSASSMAFAEELKLPPEVTPALRAACESDVRRLGCIGSVPTYAKVKNCVVAKYMKLGEKCKVELAAAGYSGPSNVPKSSVKAAGSAVKAAGSTVKSAGILSIFD
jgi:hypothetical protein